MDKDLQSSAAGADAPPEENGEESGVEPPLDDDGFRYVPQPLWLHHYGTPLFELVGGDDDDDDEPDLAVLDLVADLAKELWESAVAEHNGDKRPAPSEKLAELMARAPDQDALLEMMTVRARLMYPDFPKIPDSDAVREVPLDLPIMWSPPDEKLLLGTQRKPVANAASVVRMHEQVSELLDDPSPAAMDRAANVIFKLINTFSDWLKERGIAEESAYFVAAIAGRFYHHERMHGLPVEEAPISHIERFLMFNLFRTQMLHPQEHAHAGSALILLAEFLEAAGVADGIAESYHFDVASIRMELTRSIVRYYGIAPARENIERYEALQKLFREDYADAMDVSGCDMPELHAKFVDAGLFVGMAQYIQFFEDHIIERRNEYEPYERKVFAEYFKQDGDDEKS